MLILKTLATLVALFIVSIAYAGDVLPFSKERVRPSNPDCSQELSAQILQFPVSQRVNASPNDDEDFSVDLPKIKRGGPGILQVPDLNTPLPTVVEVLKNLRAEENVERRLQVRKFALRLFHNRMLDLEIRHEQLSASEIDLYSKLIFHAVKNIFHNNPMGGNPLAEVVEHFYIPGSQSDFNGEARYKILSALLASVDIERATQADSKFLSLVNEWYYSHHSRAMKSNADATLEHKLKSLVGRIPALSVYFAAAQK